MSLNKEPDADGPTKNGSSNEDQAARMRLVMTILAFFAASMGLYMWGFHKAVTDMETSDLVVRKPIQSGTTSNLRPPIPSPPTAAPVASANTAAETLQPVSEKGSTPSPSADPKAASEPVTEPPVSEGESPSSGGGDFDKACSDLCTKREASRKEKYGGDLLNFEDISKLAETARDKLEETLRTDDNYGEYFDAMFLNGTNPDGGTRYYGMEPPTDRYGTSRERMKRKMKIKVLKMMASVKATESNVNGCDCIGKSGSLNGDADDDTLNAVPEFYEKYVFANGGHSNAASHGNMFTESYTAVFGNDVRPVWEAIGIEMIDRNYAMGAMRSNPIISLCIKETFGVDVDFLVWNYGMTDAHEGSATHYVFRGAMLPNRPAILFMGWVNGPKICKAFEPIGLAMFHSSSRGPPAPTMKGLPDMSPDGIPLTEAEAEKVPAMARYVKCNGRLEGKDLCFQNKWSCTKEMRENGVECICPNVGKRSSWHQGYRVHGLDGHLLALPFIEMLLEALKELAAAPPTDTEQLLADLQKEEDEDFKLFMESPLSNHKLAETAYFENLGEPTSELFETWFRGNSICRTAYLPAQSRFLGLTTNDGKTGDVAIYTHETYETGFYTERYLAVKDFDFLDDKVPPPGEFSIIATVIDRSGSSDIEEYEKSCPAVVMPDYKDNFYAPTADRKASITIPNQREREYYEYDPKLFKGVVALVFPLFTKGPCKKVGRDCHSYDFRMEDILDGNVTITVNSKPVKNAKIISDLALFLIGEDDNPFFEPDPQTQDYKIEFQVAPEAEEYHFRFGNFVVM